MRRKTKSIHVNAMANGTGAGISVEKIAVKDIDIADKGLLNTLEEGMLAHRHDSHSFFLLESGTICIEFDFQKYTMSSPTLIYVHPDQVHRTIASHNVVVSCWAITNENLNPEYLKLLEDITPAKPLVLDEATFTTFSQSVALAIQLAERKKDKLHHLILRDSCNALVAMVLSQYLELSKQEDRLTRFDVVTKSFRQLLERNYAATKRPADYAQKLNLSIPYLNECVKNATGFTVSHQIQQRVILEAKRMLYYSNKSVKEIAAALGYDDYPYFSRLFTKITGMSVLAFRNKNLD